MYCVNRPTPGCPYGEAKYCISAIPCMRIPCMGGYPYMYGAMKSAHGKRAVAKVAKAEHVHAR